ncbi:MAG: hypothetical protein HW421_3206 [Ignavibacteria bacterium]|nr:hypothetical protein [Ignavibacteria bacterium]
MDKVEKKESSGSTVLKFINNFKDALLALIPVFDRCNIKWADDQQFDDFEGISEALFKWIVSFSLENIAVKVCNVVPDMPNYGFFYKDISKLSFIEVISKTEEKHSGMLVFVALKSNDAPFDSVHCNKIDGMGHLIEEDIVIPLEDVNFRFLLRLPNGKIQAFV